MKKIVFSFLLIFHILTSVAHEGSGKSGIDLSEIIPGQPLTTEDPYIKFDHLTKKNGLSSNYILDILQDKYGFIWIATIEGLNRYDGYNIKQYKHSDTDSCSISNNLVTCLKEDANGNLWIGTQNGLNIYNRMNDSFESVVFNKSEDQNSSEDNYIRAILPDNQNIIWIETASGDLIKYDDLNDSSTSYHHKPPSMINTYFYHDLYKDKNGKIWLGGRFMGIFRFDLETEQFYKYKPDENDITKKRENDVSFYYSDSQNNFWLGGIDGLYKLDIESEIFTKSLSISSFTVVEDYKNRLWFGTGAGIYIYDIIDDSFTLVNKDANNTNSLIHDHINKIYIDNAQNIWIGTNDGISIFRPSKNKFRHIHHIPGDERTPTSSNVTSILQLTSGEIWIGTENSGIDCVGNRFIKTKNYSNSDEDGNKLNSNKISVLIQDSEGDVWAGQWSGRGFNIINPGTQTIQSFTFLNNSLKADWYNDFFEDSKGNFWVGIWGAQGLFQFDKERGKFKDQTFILRNLYQNLPVEKLEFDGDKIWIGLRNQSVFYALNPLTKKYFTLLKDNYYSYGFSQILKIHKDRNNGIWFKTDKGFYHKHNNPNTSIVPVNYIPEFSSNNNNTHIMVLNSEYDVDTILSEKIDLVGDAWIGTFKGLFRIREDKIVNHYTTKTHNGLINDTIWALTIVPPDQLWIGTEKGICELSFETEKISPLIIDKKSYLSSHLIKCLAEDRIGNIWVGTTNNGINRLNPGTHEVKQFNSNLDEIGSFWGDLVNCIFIDNSGILWAGGYGLNKYNPDSATFSHYTIDNGLADNGVMSILEDDLGNLWIATLNGLSVFDPKNESFKNFNEEDGLQDNEFTNAACRLNSGEFAFGGKNGINICNPSDIFINKRPPQLSILSFSVFDQKKEIGITKGNPIDLKHDENYFSIEYTALDFSKPDHIKYAFKLENADKDWTYTDALGRIAKYTNIDPGKYRFRVKASNGDGIWNEEGTYIDIVIKPPFWKTTWFMILEILIVVLIIILIIKYREKKIIEKNQFQLLEQKLLRSQMNPHFIFNSLSSIQSFIFENNPIEAGSYLSRFAELIRSILYNSREEFITIEKEIKTLKNYLDLQQLRYNNKFDYILDVDPLIEIDVIKIPPMLAQPFIENAIEHGIKHLEGSGYISVSFTLMSEDKSILLLVEDNGIGLKASKKIKKEKPKSHTSLATVIANERIDAFNRGRKKKLFIMDIDDIKSAEGKVEGTKVKFIIPYLEH